MLFRIMPLCGQAGVWVPPLSWFVRLASPSLTPVVLWEEGPIVPHPMSKQRDIPLSLNILTGFVSAGSSQLCNT